MDSPSNDILYWNDYVAWSSITPKIHYIYKCEHGCTNKNMSHRKIILLLIVTYHINNELKVSKMMILSKMIFYNVMTM